MAHEYMAKIFHGLPQNLPPLPHPSYILNVQFLNDPYVNVCIPDIVKNINLTVFNLISRTNETRYTKLHETCKCKCRLMLEWR